MALFIRTHQGLLDGAMGKAGVFGAFGTPPGRFLAASTTVPAIDATNITEPGGGVGYARIAFNEADFDATTAADPAILTNNATISFAQATGAWGTIVAAVWFDALTGGNPVAPLGLTASITINALATLEFEPGRLVLAAV